MLNSTVLNNLFSNAIKFTDEGFVSLSIAKSSQEGYLEFCVRDTGKGIPKDRLDIIFEPFRQVEYGDARTHGGTGLGLTICRKLVEVMGGEMRVESCTDSASQGSRFFFTLPYQPVKAESQAEHDASGHTSFSSVNRRTHRSGNILLAEDDTISRKVAKQILMKAGFNVLEARDGLEAVSLFQSHRDELDLILMDVMMPHMDGIAATERIRAIETDSQFTEYIPIVALSAGAMKGDKEQGLAVGMTDYLTKPISRVGLLETLSKYIAGDENTSDDKAS